MAKKKKLVSRSLTLPDGTVKTFRGVTAQIAEEKLNAARIKLGLGLKLNDLTTVGELAQTWYTVYRKPQLRSPNSQAAVLNVVNNHILPHLAPMLVRDVTTTDIQQVLSAMEGKSASLTGKARTAMRGMFEVAVAEHLILTSPVVTLVKAGGVPTDERDPLTKKQKDMLLAALPPEGPLRLFIYIGLYSGLRRGEICGLTWDNVDLSGRKIYVRKNARLRSNAPTEVAEILKTPSARRNIPIPRVLARELKAARETSNSEYVVAMEDGRPMSYSAYRAMWRYIKRRTAPSSDLLGTPTSPKSKTNHGVNYAIDFPVTAHILRHTYITDLFDAKKMDLKQIQYLAGHKDAAVTLKIYIHYLQSRQHDTAAAIDEAFDD